jgi:hypothetical protein
MDDTVINVAQRLENAVKANGTRPLTQEQTKKLLSEISNDAKLLKASAAKAAKSTVDLKAIGSTDMTAYRWNLPPHAWSLPVNPSSMGGETANPQSITGNAATDTLRRGRIYWYSRVETTYTDGKDAKSGTQSSGDPRYGFQFIWNPNIVTTNVSVNMDITPTSEDKFAKVVGAFPSGESLTLSLRLDRTNDMFCIRSHKDKGNTFYSPDHINDIAKYYKNSLEKNFSNEFPSKLRNLINLGTIADIEYLYKAINGPNWTNPATGRETADIGFLSPTLLRIDIGPLSYIGYVASLNVTHTDFNQAMIPIRSDVNVQFNLMATAGLSSAGRLVST